MSDMLKNKRIAEKIRDELLKHKLSLAVAESVTCGHLQSAFASIKDTGLFFQGGITVYNLGQKARHLKIEPIAAEQCNCVSAEVAAGMAREVAELFVADVGIGITGYASPVPEIGVHELFAYFSIYCKKELVCTEKISAADSGKMEFVQKKYCQHVLERVYEWLSHQS